MGDRIIITVEDTGIGMDEDTQSRIFQRFFQARERSPAIIGTGLGLSIVRELVALMHGEMRLRSHLGEGSTFTVELPLPTVEETDGEKAEPDGVAPETLVGRVLLVEDDAVNRRVVRLLLANTSLEIETAATGEEAIERFVEGGWDLILMDFQLPGMDGLELARWIRSGNFSRLRQNVPIVAATANATPEAEAACAEAGMDAFLAKPLRRPLLLQTLAVQLQRPRDAEKEA